MRKGTWMTIGMLICLTGSAQETIYTSKAWAAMGRCNLKEIKVKVESRIGEIATEVVKITGDMKDAEISPISTTSCGKESLVGMRVCWNGQSFKNTMLIPKGQVAGAIWIHPELYSDGGGIVDILFNGKETRLLWSKKLDSNTVKICYERLWQ